MTEDPKVGMNDFVLVKFLTKKTTVYYIGRVVDIDSDMQSHSVREKESETFFHFSLENDSSIVEKSENIIKLPQPQIIGNASQAQSYFSFIFDLSK